ncbi:uncharacterized protein KZ484_019225 isoform 2-T2 [Pholidichthys leucotaenia]
MITSEDDYEHYGLQNQGATCYLNSVLQVLFMTKDFREAVLSYADKHPESCAIDHHLAALFKELQNNIAQTRRITEVLGIDTVYGQRDAAEYLERVLTLTNPKASQIFHGCLANKISCSECHSETDRDAPFWHLPLPLKNFRNKVYSVVDGIGEFFKASELNGDNKMYCDRCDDKVNATVSEVIKDHPDVLILLLKRFEFSLSKRSYVKINQPVDVPSTIKIPQNQTYELYAVVDHSGDLRGGHYTATIKFPKEHKWYKFDDTRVEGVRQLEIQPLQMNNKDKSRTAYLLFYRKKKDVPVIGEESTSGGFPHAVNNNSNHSQDHKKIRNKEKGEAIAEVSKIPTVSADKSDESDVRKITSSLAALTLCEKDSTRQSKPPNIQNNRFDGLQHGKGNEQEIDEPIGGYMGGYSQPFEVVPHPKNAGLDEDRSSASCVNDDLKPERAAGCDPNRELKSNAKRLEKSSKTKSKSSPTCKLGERKDQREKQDKTGLNVSNNNVRLNRQEINSTHKYVTESRKEKEDIKQKRGDDKCHERKNNSMTKPNHGENCDVRLTETWSEYATVNNQTKEQDNRGAKEEFKNSKGFSATGPETQRLMENKKALGDKNTKLKSSEKKTRSERRCDLKSGVQVKMTASDGKQAERNKRVFEREMENSDAVLNASKRTKFSDTELEAAEFEHDKEKSGNKRSLWLRLKWQRKKKNKQKQHRTTGSKKNKPSCFKGLLCGNQKNAVQDSDADHYYNSQ